MFLLTLALTRPLPAYAATLTVCAAGCTFSDFQVALDAAQPGDTILLRAGETFVGQFVLPAKAGDATILVRSDAPDTTLPAAGTRLIPHGYPGGNTDRSLLARLRGRGGQWRTTPVLTTAPGAHHFRFQFLDIDGIVQDGWETLVEIGTSAPSQNTMESVPYSIVFDRVFIHGHPTRAQKRCIALNGRNLEVLNSYVVDCASFEFDSQAIAGFNGPGPIRILNNHVEGSGENIMFGGADPKIHGLVPSDIEIRRNHIVKPLTWRDPILARPDAPAASVIAGGGSVGSGTYYFTVVAVLESGGGEATSAQSSETAIWVGGASDAVTLSWTPVARADRYRVYVGNSPGAQDRFVVTTGPSTSLIYYGYGETWAMPPVEGTRWSVKNLLELKNAQRVVIDGNVLEQNWAAAQTGYAVLFTPRNDGGTAPWSTVRDVTFSNNVVRHVAGAINLLGYDDVHGSEQTAGITIRNNLFYDLSGTWSGPSHLLLVTSSPRDIKVDHNTAFLEGMVVLADAGSTVGFEFTNNVAPHNTYGFFGSSAGTGTAALDAYFPGAIMRRNALGGGPAALYPPDNFFPDMGTFLSQFVNAAGNDFRLTATSTFRGAATDGSDLGVDYNALAAAVRGVVVGDSTWDSSAGTPVINPSVPDPVIDAGTGSGAPSAPVPSTAIALPGTIEAENFNDGSNGVSYLDTTGGNYGGQYRGTDVDIEVTTDAGGGYDIGWLAPGEWLTYRVTVATSGSYDIDVRAASVDAGATFHLEVNGQNVTGPLVFVNTGGWQAWTTLTKPAVSLAAGEQTLRLVIDSANASGVVGNINYIRVRPASTPVSLTPISGAIALPGVIQAEDFDAGGEGLAYHDHSAGNSGGAYRDTDVDLAPADDLGGGYTIGWLGAGEWLKYTVNVASAGTYALEIRVASAGPGGTFHLEVDGVDRTGPIAVPDTGGWQAWTTIRPAAVSLNAGRQTWRLVMDSNGVSGAVGNINFVGVAAASSATAPVPARSGQDIVLYASDVASTSGNWARVPSSSGAGGEKMQSDDRGWSAVDHALAQPADYFELRFAAEAQRAYRVWVRLRADGDSKYNDSVWLQFSNATDATGAAKWRIGTAAALLVNLEACGTCGSAGWGWQNRAWWLEEDPVVWFPSGEIQSIRVQAREDGVDIDQIVLSPVAFFDIAPGQPLNDATIVPKR